MTPTLELPSQQRHPDKTADDNILHHIPGVQSTNKGVATWRLEYTLPIFITGYDYIGD